MLVILQRLSGFGARGFRALKPKHTNPGDGEKKTRLEFKRLNITLRIQVVLIYGFEPQSPLITWTLRVIGVSIG